MTLYNNHLVPMGLLSRYSFIGLLQLFCLCLSVVHGASSDKFRFERKSVNLNVAVNTSLPWSGSFEYNFLNGGSHNNRSSFSDALFSLFDNNGTLLGECNTHAGNFTSNETRSFSWSLEKNEGLTCWFSQNYSQTFNVSDKIRDFATVVVKIGGFAGCLSDLRVQNYSISCANYTRTSSVSKSIVDISPDDIPCGCDFSDFEQDNETVAFEETSSSNDTAEMMSELETTTAALVVTNDESESANATATTAESTNETLSSNETAAKTTVRLSDNAVSTTSVTKNASDDGALIGQSTTVVTTTSTALSTTTTPVCTPHCFNGGTCVIGTPRNYCKCPTTAIGGNCAYTQVCQVYPGVCLHGGTCEDGTKYNNTAVSNKQGNNTFVCDCAKGFTGEYCHQVSSGKLSGGAIAAIVICILLAIVLAVGAVFLVRFIRRSRKLKGKYNPAKEEMNAGNGPPLPMQALSRDERLI